MRCYFGSIVTSFLNFGQGSFGGHELHAWFLLLREPIKCCVVVTCSPSGLQVITLSDKKQRRLQRRQSKFLQVFQMERDTNQMSQSPSLCRSGCGFYGSPKTDGLCSKCYKDALKRKQANPAPPQLSGRTSPTASSAVSTSTKVDRNHYLEFYAVFKAFSSLRTVKSF
ncbi:hypothetical protein AVEN_201051-1 [Araneus ventricosus]|uniref:A20-type domain-containing protein n=1 Tax=Araneus ventricosus TaxID=182803 RepID=A0A4Y2MQ21_ARAVE|nr:hypothetical protein AVEN_201051-1 [Araneus ventricosus]